MMVSDRMNKSEFTFSWVFRRHFLTLVILTGFVCSLNAGVYWSARSDSERRSGSLAIHTGIASVRIYALTNGPNPRRENNFATPKPVKQNAQPGALPEKVSRLNVTERRPPFDGEVLLNKFSACCSPPQGRAPPLFA
jgi:hypothetical protein